MAGESITFDFLSKGADGLARDFKKTGDNAALAAKGARLCADALEKQRKAADVSAGATLALAKADTILADAEEELSGRAALADAALRGQGDAAKKAGRDAAEAAGGFGGLAGAGGIPGGGMGAAIAAGVALSPVIATLGVGLGGLGLAAAGIISPIEKAAGKTGGLAANMGKLDPEQQAVAQSILGLGRQYDAFQKALKPEVLGIFNTGIRLAGGLLRDIQPVAAATGKAFNTFLGTVDAEFRSQTWQQFFGFMAREAGPDMTLLGNAILPLLDTLPKLLTDIQPIAVQFLQAAAGAAKLGDSAITLNEKIQHLGSQADHSSGFMGRLADAGKKALAQMLPGIPAAQALGKWLGVVGDNSGKAATSTQGAGVAFKGAWPPAQSYAQWVQQSAVATRNLANAQSAAVSAQVAYGNDILTSANDAQTFHDKLRASAGQIGLHTQAQRDSFGAANTYIGDLARQATTAITSGHGTDAAIGAIRRGLPVLDSAKTKNRQYWQEVSTLVSYLHKLELIKFISTPIHVTGTGKWSVTGTTITPGVAHGPQNIGAAPTSSGAAAGLYINRGTGPTADDVMIRASKGELIVPAGMVKAGAVDHLRGSIPGFAAGGVAGSYGPAKVSGLPPWISGRINATDTTISQNTAQAILNAMAAAQKAAKAQAAASKAAGLGNLPLGTGPHSGSAAVAQAFAKSILWAYGWGQNQFPPLQALWNQESGWNSYAVNPSSGAYGIPQALGHGHPYNLGDYQAQIRWGLAYIKQRYGSPAAAEAHELANHWYARGGLVPGYASGGAVGAWRSRMAGLQGRERHDYAGLVHAFGRHPAGAARTDLARLARLQAAEQKAYAAAVAPGITGNAGPAGPLISALRSEAATAKDKALAKGHPGWVHGLGYWLGQLTTAAGREPAAPAMPWAAWLPELKSSQAHEAADYAGLQAAFRASLARAPHSSWAYKNRGAIGERLYAVALKQNAEVAAYRALAAHATGSITDLNAQPGLIGRLGSQAAAELGALQPALLGHKPGGHPGWVRGLQGWLRDVAALTGPSGKPVPPPWNPGQLGPSHTAGGGVLTFDRGGYLPAGLSLAYNGTGRPEPVIPAGRGAGGGGVPVVLEVSSGGASEFEQFMLAMIRRFVHVKGGGSAQAAFGRR